MVTRGKHLRSGAPVLKKLGNLPALVSDDLILLETASPVRAVDGCDLGRRYLQS
jgi:hypothetical protein